MYDYIIVGAGSSGCVLANKLSKNINVSVCLIEAGPKNNSRLISTPLGIAALMWHPKFNWRFYTQPEPHLNNRRLYCPRGRVVGGSSSINAMVYMRGQPEDYNFWASLGNRGWSYAELEPYFEQIEGLSVQAASDGGLREGLSISAPRYLNPLSHVFLEAAYARGLPPNLDFNSGHCFGAGPYALTQKNGKRCSSADAFLAPALGRPNLRVITGATATKILLEQGRAVGVQYSRGNRLLEVRCHQELIISSGAIGSPSLLLRSGIGPADELEARGVEVNHDLPGVGKNLQDHLDVLVTHKCKTKDTFGLSWSFLAKFLREMGRYSINNMGMLCSNVAEVGAFSKTSSAELTPDLQFHFSPAFLYKHAFSLQAAGHYYSLHVALLNPKSRGEVTLDAEDPFGRPDIRFNYLAEEEDLTKLLVGLKQAREILNDSSFSNYKVEEVYPGPLKLDEQDLSEYIRNCAETIYHPVGTCKMGNDANSVVDEQLRVHGLHNLRVADASIMPTIVSGNTNSAAMAIGAKAADLILDPA